MAKDCSGTERECFDLRVFRVARFCRIDNDKAGSERRLDDFTLDSAFGHSFLGNCFVHDIAKVHKAFHFAHDWQCMRIPLRKNLLVFNILSVFDAQCRTIVQLRQFLFRSILCLNFEVTRAVCDLEGSVSHFKEFDIDILDFTVLVSLIPTFCSDVCRAADVEGSQCKLCAGFADGLCRDDADSFAEFNHLAC